MKSADLARFIIGALIVGFASSGSSMAAEPFPTKPIRLVVPFPPGGGVDTLARQVAPPLSEVLGKQLVIDNRAGGGGLIGNQIVAQAKADGYTLLLQGIPFVVAPQLSSSTGYDAEKDFASVVLVASTPIVLVVHPSVPAKSLKEFVAHAKAQDGKVNMASGGSGATAHLSAELFKLVTQAPFTHIPYKGMGPAVADVISGRVQSIFATLPSALPHIQSGRLKALVVTSPKRSQSAPDLPTTAEAGYPALQVVNWYGLLAPQGLPTGAADRISSAVGEVLQRKDIRERLAGSGLDPNFAAAREFKQFIREEVERWSRVVKASGMRVE